MVATAAGIWVRAERRDVQQQQEFVCGPRDKETKTGRAEDRGLDVTPGRNVPPGLTLTKIAASAEAFRGIVREL